MRPIDISSTEAERAAITFPGTPMWRVLHNELLRRLEEKRTKLEHAKPEELSRIQGEITELRQVLGLLHEKDSATLKATYG